MSTHSIDFYEGLTKIIFELSSNITKYHQIGTLFLLLWLAQFLPGLLFYSMYR